MKSMYDGLTISETIISTDDIVKNNTATFFTKIIRLGLEVPQSSQNGSTPHIL